MQMNLLSDNISTISASFSDPVRGATAISAPDQGTTVEAKVLFAAGGRAKLTLESGVLLRACLDGDTVLREGETVRLFVRDNSGGRLVLQLLDSEAAGAGEADGESLLSSLKLPATKDNLHLVLTLKEYGLPVNAKTWQALSAIKAQYPGLGGRTAAFALANGIELTADGAHELAKLAAGEVKVASGLAEIVKTLSGASLAGQASGAPQAADGSGDRTPVNTGETQTDGKIPAGPRATILSDFDGEIASGSQPTLLPGAGVENAAGPLATVLPDSDGKIPAGSQTAVLPGAGMETASGLQPAVLPGSDGETASGLRGTILPGSDGETAAGPRATILPDSDGETAAGSRPGQKPTVREEKSALSPTSVPEGHSGTEGERTAPASFMEKTLAQLFARPDAQGEGASRLSEAGRRLPERLALLSAFAEQLPTEEGKDALRQIGILQTDTKLFQEINQFTYLQIPVKMGQREQTAELYVFRRNGKSRKIDPEDVSLLVALDTEGLGHVESLIRIKGRSLSVRFALPGERQAGLVREHTAQLSRMLAQIGYRLSEAKVEILTEPTTPVSALSALQAFLPGGGRKVNIQI